MKINFKAIEITNSLYVCFSCTNNCIKKKVIFIRTNKNKNNLISLNIFTERNF